MKNGSQLSLFADDNKAESVSIGGIRVGTLVRTKRGHLCTVVEIDAERGCVFVQENGRGTKVRCPVDMKVQVLG